MSQLSTRVLGTAARLLFFQQLQQLARWRRPRAAAILGLLLLAPAAFAQPTYDFALAHGRVAESFNHTAIDPLGNTYVSGAFNDSTHLGPFVLHSAGNNDGYLAKFDPTGRCLWAQRVGGTGGDGIASLAIDAAGNVFVVGSTSSDTGQFGGLTVHATNALGNGFVAKLDANGNWQWLRLTVATGEQYVNELALDAQANLYVLGSYGGTSIALGNLTVTNPGWSPAVNSFGTFVARLDGTGNWQWAIAGNAGVAAQLGNLAVDARGHVAVSGYLLGTATLGPATLSSAGSYDVLVGQLEAATGAWRWLRRAGGPDEEALNGVACDASGHVFVTGSQASPSAQYGALAHATTAATEAFVARLDANGTFQWVSGGGSYADNTGSALAVDAQGAAYVAGRYADAPALFGNFLLLNRGNTDIFVARLDSAGAFTWAIRAGSTGHDYASGLALAGPNEVALSGWFEADSAHFGPLALVGDPNIWNGFVARLSGAPVLLRTVVPATGAPGQQVTLSGSRLGSTRAVLFNGVAAAAFSVVSATTLRATVPAGAGTGPVTVQTTAGPPTGPVPSFAVQALAVVAGTPGAGFSLWPQPAQGFVQVQGAAGAGPQRFELRTLLGATVRTGTLGPAPARLDLRGLAPGVYVLTLPGAGALSRRVVLE